jgi:hypothetical protein
MIPAASALLRMIHAVIVWQPVRCFRTCHGGQGSSATILPHSGPHLLADTVAPTVSVLRVQAASCTDAHTYLIRCEPRERHQDATPCPQQVHRCTAMRLQCSAQHGRRMHADSTAASVKRTSGRLPGCTTRRAHTHKALPRMLLRKQHMPHEHQMQTRTRIRVVPSSWQLRDCRFWACAAAGAAP